MNQVTYSHTAVSTGILMGTALAMILSYSVNNSIIKRCFCRRSKRKDNRSANQLTILIQPRENVLHACAKN